VICLGFGIWKLELPLLCSGVVGERSMRSEVKARALVERMEERMLV